MMNTQYEEELLNDRTIALINKFNPKLLANSTEYPTSYKDLKKLLVSSSYSSSRSSSSSSSSGGGGGGEQVSQNDITNIENSGNYYNRSSHSHSHSNDSEDNEISFNTTNIIDQYYEPTEIDIEDSIIYDHALNLNDDFLLKREDFFLQLKLCTEYAIYKAKTPLESSGSGSGSGGAGATSSLGMDTSSTNSSTNGVSKSGYENDEYFIRNWRHLIKDLSNLELLQKELMKNHSNSVSSFENCIDNLSKIIVLKDRLNNGLLRQLSKISFPDLNIDIKDYMHHHQNGSKNSSHREKSQKYRHRNKSMDNLKLLESKGPLSSSKRSSGFTDILNPLKDTSNDILKDDELLLQKYIRSTSNDGNDVHGGGGGAAAAAHDDDEEEEEEEDTDKSHIDTVTSYLISEVIKHNINLSLNDNSGTLNNMEFLKSCIGSLVEICSKEVDATGNVSAAEKEQPHSYDNSTSNNESKEPVLSLQNKQVTDLQTALKDLNLAHSFLTEKFAQDRFENSKNIEKLTKKTTSLSSELNEYQSQLQHEQDKFLEIVHKLNEKDDIIESLKEQLSQSKAQAQAQAQTRSLLQSPNIMSPASANATGVFDSESIYSGHSFTTPGSPSLSTINSTSYSISLMRQEFKKIIHNMNSKHISELKQEIDKRTRLEQRLHTQTI